MTSYARLPVTSQSRPCKCDRNSSASGPTMIAPLRPSRQHGCSSTARGGPGFNASPPWTPIVPPVPLPLRSAHGGAGCRRRCCRRQLRSDRAGPSSRAHPSAAANVARIAEIEAGDDPDVGARLIEEAHNRATPTVTEVLRRYPVARVGRSRAARLMSSLDASLRTTQLSRGSMKEIARSWQAIRRW